MAASVVALMVLLSAPAAPLPASPFLDALGRVVAVVSDFVFKLRSVGVSMAFNTSPCSQEVSFFIKCVYKFDVSEAPLSGV